MSTERAATEGGRALPPTGERAEGRPLRVLVVDDSPELAEAMLQLMRSFGWEGRVALTGAAALQNATEWAPDACLVDISLPDVHGAELARLLRSNSVRPIWIAAVTGHDLAGTSHGAAFDRVFTKPIRPAELQREIAALRGG